MVKGGHVFMNPLPTALSVGPTSSPSPAGFLLAPPRHTASCCRRLMRPGLRQGVCNISEIMRPPLFASCQRSSSVSLRWQTLPFSPTSVILYFLSDNDLHLTCRP